MNANETLLVQLRAAVARLAAEPAEQERYLQELGVAPLADELALDLDEVFPAAKAALDAELRDAIAALDAYLDSISNQASRALWNLDAIRNSMEWRHIRELAQEALERFPSDSSLAEPRGGCS